MSPSGDSSLAAPPMIVRTATDLANLVRDYRRRQGLTQAALAARVGASRKWMIDLEAGKRTADLSLVLRTLNALGLELSIRQRAARPSRSGEVDIDAIVAAARRGRR
jgi:HTH-type transcriptional regulator/antitoxin HipB